MNSRADSQHIGHKTERSVASGDEVFMTAPAPRFAIYFKPRAGTAWAQFGESALSGEARRYGFHATLKAPFRLSPDTRLEDLQAHLDRFCARRRPFPLPALEVRLLEDFLALVPASPEPRVDAIAAACVREFDRYRAPLSEAEIARRRAAGPLTSRQDALLSRWGYPHVLEEFRFHLSLTGRLGGTLPRELPALPAEPLAFDALCLVEEPAPGAPFRLVERYTLAGRGRLLYVVGPSGAGKDTLLRWVRHHLPGGAPVIFARRTVTRAAHAADAEQGVSVTREQFERELAHGRFAMHWRANGHAYGVGREIREWLAQGLTVVVSGSRAHLPQALADFPMLEVVHVTAAREALRARLEARGRETAAQIAHRLARAAKLEVPAGVPRVQIRNDEDLRKAGRQLLECVLGAP